MVEVKGTHGTTATRAQTIREHGFQPGGGERGRGVYFWRENTYSRDLAISWYLNAINHSESGYRNDVDKRCAVITALISVGEDEWLDLTDPDIEDALIRLISERGYTDTRHAAKLYDEFCEITEQELGTPIRLIQTRVYAPKKVKNWPTQSIGMPVCYVVKDESAINVENIELLDLEG